MRTGKQAATQGETGNSASIPPLSTIFGFGAMLPTVMAGILPWLVARPASLFIIGLGVIWAAAILAFLGGVRRGLSFCTLGGPTRAQLLTMLWLYGLAFAALLSPSRAAAVTILLVGYASVAVLDPPAARRGDVPAHFQRLRPPQMVLAIVALSLMLGFLLKN